MYVMDLGKAFTYIKKKHTEKSTTPFTNIPQFGFFFFGGGRAGHNIVIEMHVAYVSKASLMIALWYVVCLLIIVPSKILKHYFLNLGFYGTIKIQGDLCLFL